MNLKSYHHSGTVPLRSLAAGVLFAAMGAVLAGSATAAVEHYIPLTYIKLVIIAAAGFGSGAAAAYGLRVTGTRNNFAGLVFATLASIGAWYLSWVYWIGFHLPEEMLLPLADRISNPYFHWEMAMLISESGTWSIGSSKEAVSGVPLLVCWGLEGLGFVSLGAIAGSLAMKGVFCERCEIWVPSNRPLATFKDPLDRPGFVSMIQQGRFDEALSNASLAQPLVEAGKVFSLYLSEHCCPRCRRTRTISLDLITTTMNKKGETNTATKSLLDRLLLTEDDGFRLENVLSKFEKELVLESEEEVVEA
jgi:hypothetical protein